MKLVLYTYQTIDAVEKLKKDGVLRLYEKDRYLTHLTRYDDSDYNYFEYPYKYMIHEMKKRLPAPKDKDTFYPIWGWYKVNGRYCASKELDKIHEGLVKLKVEIDESRVLLSDFDVFAAVISGRRILKEDDDTLDYDADNKFDPSLERMFELHRKEDDYFGFSFRKETIQGTFWELFIEDVIEIIDPVFKNRSRKKA